ncbi:MAG: class I SAM-dependent methyltransferase [bacterium]|nr:class I SAM-dependent methyltransferase [bacterium]
MLRVVYNDCYDRILRECRPGPLLEIGGGVGNLKSQHGNVVALDIQQAPWLDLVADAHCLPFAAGSFDSVVLFDVLHHLERPALFLSEVVDVMRPGARLVFCEPAITPLSYLFYRFLHSEPLAMGTDPLEEGPVSPDRDPYDSNQAIPSLLFRRPALVTERFPELRLASIQWLHFLAYPLSGGFRPWSMISANMARRLLAIERRLEPWVARWLGFRMIAVLEKIQT